jgi:hypothetical protein
MPIKIIDVAMFFYNRKIVMIIHRVYNQTLYFNLMDLLYEINPDCFLAQGCFNRRIINFKNLERLITSSSNCVIQLNKDCAAVNAP